MTAKKRLTSIDGMRGLIIALMALDHASFFVARAHASEYWGVGLPVYPGGFAFATRLVTHLCAPGFFLLMGMGITLFALRRQEVGFPEAKIRGQLVKRGVLILVIQQALENPAWGLGFWGPVDSYGTAGPPGDGNAFPFVILTVLFALGATMIIGAWIRAWSSSVLLAVAAASLVVTDLALPSDSRAALSPVRMLLVAPGFSGRWFVLYPVVPWLAPMCIGLVLGRVIARDFARAMRAALATGIGFLIAFVVLRSLRGFGNIHRDFGAGWIDFLNMTKYPPSLVFVLFTLGVDLLLLVGLAKLGEKRVPAPLLAFGRAPMFFYIAHLWLLAVIGRVLQTELLPMYLVWLAALAALWPLCSWYARFRSTRPPGSLWRLV